MELKDFIAICVSFISLIISIMAYRAGKSRYSDEKVSELIRQNFGEFISLHEVRAQYPLQSHLFELGNEYKRVVTEVQAVLSNIKQERPSRALELRLEERAVARRVFSMYEHAYYQWINVCSFDDKTRKKFLEDVLFYYTDRLLTNPRLAWFWAEAGANQSRHYEIGTRDYYHDKVKLGDIDPDGPFKT